jgi:5-methylcytosine-specific restriction enzyme subunit McrC
MERLFELFLRNALRRLLHDEAEVRAETVRWDDAPDFGSSLMPRMRTDLTIRGTESCMVIDAKYYKEPFTVHATGKTLLRSAHLYQIYAYASNMAATDLHRRPWKCALAYARAGAPFDLRYELRGIPFRLVGIDLEAEPDVVLAQVRGLWGGGSVSVRY